MIHPLSLSFRSSACDRPRTYDRFYQKTPGNFHDGHGSNKSHNHGGVTETDSAISVCSSEEDKRTASEDKRTTAHAQQAPPAGSTSAPSQRKVKKTKKRHEAARSRDEIQ